MKACWALVFVFAAAVCEEDANTTVKTHEQGTVEERTRLFKNLMVNYDKNINPDNADVKFGVALLDINLAESTNTLESNVWLRYSWKDSRLTWDSSDYGGVGVLRLDSNLFWKPDIALYNGADLSRSSSACWDSNVLVYENGEMLWVPPCSFKSYCKNTLKEHPYEAQNCTLKFGSWTYDAGIMGINFYNNETRIDMSDFADNSGWKAVSTTAVKNVKYYSCCAEPYADLTFSVTLKRKPASEALCSA